jgi:hypothetical protein
MRRNDRLLTVVLRQSRSGIFPARVLVNVPPGKEGGLRDLGLIAILFAPSIFYVTVRYLNNIQYL